MLTNFDIERLCKKLDLPLIGVFSKDELSGVEREIGSYYINMQSSTDGDGSHWCLAKIYCDDDRDGSDDSDGEEVVANALYFDPFGLGMPKETASFLRPFKPVYCNNRQIQSVKSTECGWYCLACDYILEHKKHSDTYLEDYEKFLEMWSKKPSKNLAILKDIFKPL